MSRQLTSGVLGRKKADVWLYKGEVWEYEEVTSPHTGRVWMDRNLGASRVAQSNLDTLAYGDYFQWGRLDDLHQNSDSGERLDEFSSTDIPGHGDFITSTSAAADWRSPLNDDLWQPETRINLPAPKGWRIPSTQEWLDETLTWTSGNPIDDMFNSFLKLTRSGWRAHTGIFTRVGSDRVIYNTYNRTQETVYCDVFFVRSNGLILILDTQVRIQGLPTRLIKEI